MKTESKIRTFGITAIIFSSLYLMAYVKDNEFKTVNQAPEQFVNGQILYPDYVINDTLVVINAKLLNDEIGNCDGSDGSYNDLLGEGCVNIADYEDYINVLAKQ